MPHIWKSTVQTTTLPVLWEQNKKYKRERFKITWENFGITTKKCFLNISGVRKWNGNLKNVVTALSLQSLEIWWRVTYKGILEAFWKVEDALDDLSEALLILTLSFWSHKFITMFQEQNDHLTVHLKSPPYNPKSYLIDQFKLYQQLAYNVYTIVS